MVTFATTSDSRGPAALPAHMHMHAYVCRYPDQSISGIGSGWVACSQRLAPWGGVDMFIDLASPSIYLQAGANPYARVYIRIYTHTYMYTCTCTRTAWRTTMATNRQLCACACNTRTYTYTRVRSISISKNRKTISIMYRGTISIELEKDHDSNIYKDRKIKLKNSNRIRPEI